MNITLFIIQSAGLLLVAIFGIAAAHAAAKRWPSTPAALGAMAGAAVDYVQRLWRFWGPRFTDRNFVQAVLMNSGIVTMFSIAPATLNVFTLGLTIAANLLNPTWDGQPAGEKLAGNGSALKILARSPEEAEALRAMLEDVIAKYAK